MYSFAVMVIVTTYYWIALMITQTQFMRKYIKGKHVFAIMHVLFKYAVVKVQGHLCTTRKYTLGPRIMRIFGPGKTRVK